MILVDFSQISMAALSIHFESKTTMKMDEDYLRHVIFNSLRSINMLFKMSYGKLVICCDGKDTWRRDIFPYYKAMRKNLKEQSKIDWEQYYKFLNELLVDIETHFEYPVIKIDKAEADDVIASLANHYSNNEKIIIVSGDKDFGQLLNDNIKQYSPRDKKYIQVDNIEEYLFEHIVRGDSIDGIPNIKSNDDCFVTKTRQGNITAQYLDYVKNNLNSLNTSESRNFHRNKMLIDLSNTPEHIKKSIIENYEKQKDKKHNGVMKYFAEKRMKKMLEQIGNF